MWKLISGHNALLVLKNSLPCRRASFFLWWRCEHSPPPRSSDLNRGSYTQSCKVIYCIFSAQTDWRSMGTKGVRRSSQSWKKIFNRKIKFYPFWSLRRFIYVHPCLFWYLRFWFLSFIRKVEKLHSTWFHYFIFNAFWVSDRCELSILTLNLQTECLTLWYRYCKKVSDKLLRKAWWWENYKSEIL